MNVTAFCYVKRKVSHTRFIVIYFLTNYFYFWYQYPDPHIAKMFHDCEYLAFFSRLPYISLWNRWPCLQTFCCETVRLLQARDRNCWEEEHQRSQITVIIRKMELIYSIWQKDERNNKLISDKSRISAGDCSLTWISWGQWCLSNYTTSSRVARDHSPQNQLTMQPGALHEWSLVSPNRVWTVLCVINSWQWMHLCPEMQAVTKMADLTKFRQTDVGQIGDFYANYVTRDIPDMLANLTILAIFIQIMSPEISLHCWQNNLAIFMQIMSPEISLTCWRIWRFWQFLCK